MSSTPAWLAGLALVGSMATASQAAPSAEQAAHPRCQLRGPYDYPHGSDPVRLRPGDFTTRIDNAYWPMRPGTTWRLVEHEGGQTMHIRITVTHRTTMIEGVRARVVHDVSRSGGELVEDTLDWYAQDSGGNIWYLGENTKEYENGEVVSTEGSWRHGRGGAQAGVLIPADPEVGCGYREEYLDGEAQDRAQVLSLREDVKGPTGFHRDVLHTANTTPLEPRLLENKFYARGVGPILALGISPALGDETLVEVTRP